jgi:hypothetical protein
MIFFKFNVNSSIRQSLGTRFVRVKQLNWLVAILSPIQSIMNEYDEWRKRRFYLIQITSQVIALTGYLNDQFDPILRQIYIVTLNDYTNGEWIALESELEPFVYLGLDNENTGAWLAQETEQNTGLDFIVYIPIGIVQINQIKQAVTAYKLAGKTFSIETFNQ